VRLAVKDAAKGCMTFNDIALLISTCTWCIYYWHEVEKDAIR